MLIVLQYNYYIPEIQKFGKYNLYIINYIIEIKVTNFKCFFFNSLGTHSYDFGVLLKLLNVKKTY